MWIKGYDLLVYKSLGYFDRKKSSGTELLIYAAQKKFKIKELEINLKKEQINLDLEDYLNRILKF